MNENVFSDPRIFHLIVEASPAGMVIADAKGKIVLVNDQAETILGYSRQEMVGRPVEMLIPEVHHSAHISARESYSKDPRARQMSAGRDLFAKRKDGTQVAVDISLHPLKTESGTYVLANILDATDRQQANRDRESRQALERLALLGQLAGGVAHEIRTPLCVIRNDVYYLKILADKLGLEGAECVQEIDQAVGKAERIVSELLDFTGDPPCRLVQVKVADLIHSAISHAAVPKEVQLMMPDLGDDWIVEADQEQIERALINLLRNAIQAMNESGIIEIKVGKGDGLTWIEVADDGPGILPSDLERIFEPLFTTKPTGIGLGLAVSRRYATRSGGSLTVADQQRNGASFRLTLQSARTDDGETA